MDAREQADKLLNDRAMLLFGVPYDALDASKADQVMLEALSGFDGKLIELADDLGGEA